MLALHRALVCLRPLCRSVRSGCQAWLSTCSPDPKPPLKKQRDEGSLQDFRSRLVGGPSLQHFLQSATPTQDAHRLPVEIPEDPAPYLGPLTLADSPKKVYLETFGCQMNVSDTETAWAILQRSGYQRTRNLAEADVVLLVTCSIREKAEQTVWNRLAVFKTLKAKRQRSRGSLRIGILGCMAERLKEKILDEEKLVDIVAGPDAYRDLPRLLAVAESGQQAANVLLSLDETYADILPVHLGPGATTAFVSIMRGCDNMCSYCIVPFTRGRERSRPLASILQEVQMLSDQGVKEVTLLGQNVNSYRDTSEVQFLSLASPELRAGFRTVYKAKKGGLRFAELLDRVAAVDPEMRVRFTSPHPKDFPDEVFEVMRERHNICKQVHLPAQSGSSRILEAMKRGYTRESYLELVHQLRDYLSGATLTSDFITGFCGETEADHLQTLSLLHEVGYNFAYIFAYSQRQKTRAFHRLLDDVPPEVKKRRLEELNVAFREGASRLHAAAVGQTQVVLVEGPSKRSPLELWGRNDGGAKVIFPDVEMSDGTAAASAVRAQPGDYVLVEISSASSLTLKGAPLCRTTLRGSSSSPASAEAAHGAGGGFSAAPRPRGAAQD
ncbi:mitochondrial tRNA methylthiotransferase CDK5RAP1 [Crotalus tigris]|uniref:mitochondrial tRNA methylthiotransferase CDK5RAP1 n=1 Tax=Crotalus tigris TaxID=88082 RepID=UPI00192F544C|nr:mitochondrial tRNA methylthiotransferase CDK5RAP1 [Crotalus tigris]XP_039224136.1 mitochondrial tRNA methylthiotransferase CDK5RAP1 [Crotalus tigris]XP_039224137.1 mitochondrial tRNA methylthiotransferase CDK5RAP1 [Crotalus tigris]